MSFPIKNFKIKLLSASIAAALLPQSGLVFAQDDSAVEEVIVSGFRAAAKDAIDIKRNSGSIVDAITATDIGKLPDATITDSLQRVPGVQITRSGGEGTGVNIRGNTNVTTTLNGEQFLSAGSITTILADFVDIPSTMVSGMEVYKSAEAKNVVSGFAGTVNLKTSRPFLLKDGFTALGKIEGTEGALGKKTNGTFSGFFGYNNNGELGATLNIAKGTSYLADYWNGSTGGSPGGYAGWNFTATEASGFVNKNVDVNGDGDSDDTYYVFQGHQAGNRFIERDRTGINGSIQYKINDAFELTGDAFYTKLKQHTYSANFVADQSWQSVVGWMTPDAGGSSEYPNNQFLDADRSVVTTLPGSFYTVQSGTYQARRVNAQSQTTAGTREALNTNIELSFDNGGPVTAKLRWIHAKAINDSENSTVDSQITDGSQINDLYTPVSGTPTAANPWGYGGFAATLPDGTAVPNSFTQIPIHISYAGGKQIWQLPQVALPVTNADGTISFVDEVLGSNLNRYSAKSSNLTGTYADADLDVVRLEGSYKFDDSLFGTISSFDVGVRRAERNVSKDGWVGLIPKTNQYGDVYVARWKDSASSAPVTGESYIPPISFTSLNEKGMIKGISDFYGTQGLGTIYFVDPKAMDNPLAWHTAMYGQQILAPDAPNTYDVNEVTQSAYIQANIDRDIFDMPLKGNIGLRYIKTDNHVVQSLGGGTIGNFLNGPGANSTIGGTLVTDNSYDNFLPAVNLSLNVADDKVVRFAYTKSIGSNDADGLGKGLNVNRILACNVKDKDGIAVFCASGGSQDGNPTLLPWLKNNLDISYEWYFSDNSLLSIGVFATQGLVENRKEYINRTDVTDSDGVVRGYNPNTGEFVGYVPIMSQVNYSKKQGIGKGLEFGYKQSFDFLPGIWSGFGLDANFTYSPSTSNEVDFYGNKLPGQRNSEYQSNLALWYEKDGLQARIAHNYRSKMYLARTQSGTYNLALYQKATNYIDASVSYEIYENVTAALQMTNITQEHQELYNQWESNIDSQFFNERRTTLSLQVKF